jgi:hypothetical protein
MNRVTVKLRVCPSPGVKKIILEPWGDEYLFRADDEYLEAELTGDPTWPIWIEVVDDAISVGSFDNDDAEGRILRGGVEIVASAQGD